MGWRPIPPPPRPTRLHVLKDAYMLGRLTLEGFEVEAAELLASGLADKQAGLKPPPKPPRIVVEPGRR